MAAKQIPLTCPGHTRPVVDLAYSAITEHGVFLISACKDGKPMLRHGDTGDWIGTFEGHKGAVWAVVLNDKATLAATGSADFTAKLWNAVEGKEMHTFKHDHIVKTVDFSLCETKLLTASNKKRMKIFSLDAPEKDPEVIEGLGASPKECLWLNDTTVISGCDENIVRIWDTRTLSEINTITLDQPLRGLELNFDKSFLSIASGKQALFYDTQSYGLVKSHATTAEANSVSLSPDKKTFVVGGEDFLLYRHNFETGNNLGTYHGHFGPVHCVRFSPDGEVYASGSEDGTLRLWQTNVGKSYGLWKAQEDQEQKQNHV